MSRLVVVGAGPAGLAAAYRLQAAGHDVAVLEAADVPGGRTHTEHFGPGHWSDTGAGWFLSSYPDTLALLDELGMRSLLRVLPMRGGGDLLVDGRLEPNPNSIARILTTRLATPAEKVRFFAWMAGLFLRQPGQLRPDQRYDGVRAIDDLAAIGRGPREGIVRPSFEGPFFARLDEMSATLVRSWLRALSIGTFYQVEGGTDVPFRRLGELVGVRTGVRVERIAPVAPWWPPRLP
jgi:protoporphyrinogen oxidase